MGMKFIYAIMIKIRVVIGADLLMTKWLKIMGMENGLAYVSE